MADLILYCQQDKKAVGWNSRRFTIKPIAAVNETQRLALTVVPAVCTAPAGFSWEHGKSSGSCLSPAAVTIGDRLWCLHHCCFLNWSISTGLTIYLKSRRSVSDGFFVLGKDTHTKETKCRNSASSKATGNELWQR